MRKSLSLRQFRRRRARNGNPLPRPHHAHTAGGRDISGLWEWFERGVLMATLISIGLGTWAYWEERETRLEERQTRREDAIARAWSLLTTPATGNSGKREALEYLAGQGVSLTGIDLSCAKMGGGWDAEKKKCDNPVYLVGLTLKAPAGQRVDLYRAHLEGANLWGAHLEGAVLREAHLERANLVRAHLQGALLSEAHLEGAHLWAAHLERADLRKAYLQGANLEEAHLEGATLSAAIFTDAKNIDSADFTNTWAWADQPPKGLPATIPVTLCRYQDGLRRFIRPEPCLPPD